MSEKKLDILLVDDHKLFRDGLVLLLSHFDKIGEITQASNGVEMVEFIKNHDIDLVLTDISMPIMNGIEATKEALGYKPNLKVIALTMNDDEEYYYKMIEVGAKGFLLKDSKFDEVKDAIIKVAEGENYFSETFMYNLLRNIKNKEFIKENSLLSEREHEILYLICKGYSNQEIADQLFISKRTVDKHRANLLSKTNTKNTASLVMYAIKNNLINIE